MKKLVLTIAIVLGVSFAASAQFDDNNGLFQRGATPDQDSKSGMMSPSLPGHGQTGNQDAPLGGGAMLLIGFGAA